MANITHLKWTERVLLDPRRVQYIYQRLGTAAAEDTVFSLVEEIAQRARQCETHLAKGDGVALFETAQSITALADQIGMVDVVSVASDVVACAKTQDCVASAATLARLSRVIAMSMDAIWDLQGMSV